MLLDLLRGEAPEPQGPAVVSEVIARAEVHGVLEAIAQPLLDLADLPDRDRAAVSESRLVTVARHLYLASQVGSLRGALDGSGVPWAVFKGPVLAMEAYGDPARRRYGDIDVLVAGRDFGKAVDALSDAGGTLIDTNWAHQLSGSRAEASILMPQGLHVDLHWHLCNERTFRADTSLPIEDMLARRRWLSLASGVEVPVLDRFDTFLSTALHAAMNGAYRLLWLKDVERLAAGSSGDEWQELVLRCREGRVAVAVGLVLGRSRRLLRAPVPQAVTEDLLSGHPWSSVLRQWESAAGPEAVVYQKGTRRATISAARDGLWATGRAAASEAMRKAKGVAGSAADNPLRAGGEDATARLAYLTAVTTGRI